MTRVHSSSLSMNKVLALSDFIPWIPWKTAFPMVFLTKELYLANNSIWYFSRDFILSTYIFQSKSILSFRSGSDMISILVSI